MSRSRWASTWGCASVTAVVRGAGKRARLVHRARRQHGRLAVAAPSMAHLWWVMAASVPVLALAPVALANTTAGLHAHPHHPAHNNVTATHASPQPATAHAVGVRLSYRSGQSSDPALTSAVSLVPGTGYYGRIGSPLVRALQLRLARAGDPPGPIDGRYGPLTENAVKRYQADHGLMVDGIAGPQTLAALTAPTPVLYPGAGYEAGSSSPVRVLQHDLARAGDPPGPIDGLYGPLTEQAVKRYQSSHGLSVDGIAGPRTFARLRTRVSRPAHLRLRARRPSRPSTSRPRRGPAPRSVRPVRPAPHPATRTPTTWILLVGLIGAALLMLAAVSHAARRRHRRHVPSPQPTSKGGNVVTLRREVNVGPPVDDGRDLGATRTPARHAAERGGSDAAFDLGVLLQEQGNLSAARAAYTRADARGHGPAATNLGVLMEAEGDLASAEAAYRRAAGRGDPNGAFNLGVMLEEQGNPAGAIDAYRRADERDHAAAASNLGVLLEREGDNAGAEAAYRRADQRGDPTGAFNLGVLLEERGDLARAETAYRRAEQRGHPEVAMRARSALLGLQQGERRSSSDRGRGDRHV